MGILKLQKFFLLQKIWIGTGGGSEEDRNFIELHVMGTLNGEYFNHFINLIEREHFTGREVASWIAEQFNFYSKLQKQLQISETYLYDVVGIVFDIREYRKR